MSTTLLDEVPAPDAPAPVPPPPRPRSRARRRIGLAALALLFFFGPNLAGLAGATPKEMENRPLRELPAASDGWDYLRKLDGWAVDHLPLRDHAVNTDSAIADGVFREVPAYGGQVLAGRGGWLFYHQEVQWRCIAGRPTDEVWNGVRRLAALVRGAGGQFLMTVAPDKSSIESAMLPESFPLRECSAMADQRAWAQLASNPPVGYFDLRTPLLRLRDQRGHAYYRTDSHWIPAGGAEYCQLMLERIDPNLWGGTRVDQAPVRRQTDLSMLAGRRRTETVAGATIHRDGVTVASSSTVVSGFPVHHSVARSAAAPLHQPRTLILGDSFTEVSRSQLQPFFADLTTTNWELPMVNPVAAAQLVAGAQTVVVEIVQRHFSTGRTTLLLPAVLDALEREVARIRQARVRGD